MGPAHRIRATVLLLGSLAACARSDGAGDTASAGGTVAQASPSNSSTASMPDNPTANDIANYELNMDKLRKLGLTMTYLGEAATANPGLVTSANNESAGQTIARIENAPAMNAAVRKAGWSAKDYVWTMAALVQASMMDGVLAADPTAKMPEGQNPRNVEFVRAHKREIEQLGNEAGAK